MRGGKAVTTRPWSSFMIWNHVFIVGEVIRCIIVGEGILFCLGFLTSIFSVWRHLYRETKYNTIESIAAKSTVAYLTVSSLCNFTWQEQFIPAFLKLALLSVWYLQVHDYESIHPWMHIIVAIDAHHYLSLYQAL